LVDGPGDDEGSITTVLVASITVRHAYEPWDVLPRLHVDNWYTITYSVEEIFGPCPKLSIKGKSFKRRDGGSNDTRKYSTVDVFFILKQALLVAILHLGKGLEVNSHMTRHHLW
jgi:hypothetical protein